MFVAYLISFSIHLRLSHLMLLLTFLFKQPERTASRHHRIRIKLKTESVWLEEKIWATYWDHRWRWWSYKIDEIMSFSSKFFGLKLFSVPNKREKNSIWKVQSSHLMGVYEVIPASNGISFNASHNEIIENSQSLFNQQKRFRKSAIHLKN